MQSGLPAIGIPKVGGSISYDPIPNADGARTRTIKGGAVRAVGTGLPNGVSDMHFWTACEHKDLLAVRSAAVCTRTAQMDASRLLDVLNILIGELDAGYSVKLDELVGLVTQARDTPAQDFLPQMTQAKDALLEQLTSSSVDNLVPTRKAYVRSIGAETLFGASAATRIKHLWETSAAGGPAGTTAALETFRSELGQFRGRAMNASKNLVELGITPAELRAGEFEVGIGIPDELYSNELGTLMEHLQDWNFILRVFVELGGGEDREVFLRGFSTGSPFDLFALIAIAWSARAIAQTAREFTGLYKDVLEIREIHGRLNDKGLPKETSEGMTKWEEQKVEARIAKSVEDLMSDDPPGLKGTDSPRRNELKNHLSIALKQIAHYLERHVTIEVSVPKESLIQRPAGEEDDAEYQKKLKTYNKEIAQLSQLRSDGASVGKLELPDTPLVGLPKPDRPEDRTSAKKATKKKKA